VSFSNRIVSDGVGTFAGAEISRAVGNLSAANTKDLEMNTVAENEDFMETLILNGLVFRPSQSQVERN